MAAFFMREMVWQLVGARTWRARQVYVMMPVADLHGRAPHVGAPTEKEAVLMRQPLFLLRQGQGPFDERFIRFVFFL